MTELLTELWGAITDTEAPLIARLMMLAWALFVIGTIAAMCYAAIVPVLQ